MRKHKLFITIITTAESEAVAAEERKKKNFSLISFIGSSCIHVKATHSIQTISFTHFVI